MDWIAHPAASGVVGPHASSPGGRNSRRPGASERLALVGLGRPPAAAGGTAFEEGCPTATGCGAPTSDVLGAADDLRRAADRYAVRWQIAIHDRPGAHDAVVADRDPR